MLASDLTRRFLEGTVISEPPEILGTNCAVQERFRIRGKRGIHVDTIAGIILVLWILGVSMHVGGVLIHALLVIAVVVVLFNLLSGRRSLG
jgi:hypothetical protein